LPAAVQPLDDSLVDEFDGFQLDQVEWQVATKLYEIPEIGE
jgi:hypothetical protein